MKNYNDAAIRKAVMLEYIQLQIAREDWHGVADAAMDLRDMAVEDAMMKQFQSIKDKSDDIVVYTSDWTCDEDNMNMECWE